MLSCTGKRSHRHTILHVSFSNSFGLASAQPTPQGLSGAPKFIKEQILETVEEVSRNWMFEPKLLALPGLVFDPEYVEDGEVLAECMFTSDFEDEKLKRAYMSNGNDEECEKDTPAL